MLELDPTPAARRLVGLDLGIASAHTAVIIDHHGTELARRRCHPTVDSLAQLEQAALAGAPPTTSLEIIIEPTGPAWLPIAVFIRRPWPRRVPGQLATGR